MPNFGTRFVDGWERAKSIVKLAAIPLVFSLLSFEQLLRILSFSGGSVGIQFFLPLGVIDPLQFVRVPDGTGGGFDSSAVLRVLVGVPVEGVLAAGYFGAIRDHLAGNGNTDAFAVHAGRYVRQFLVIAGIQAAFTLLFGGTLLATQSLGLGLAGILVFLVAGYLFYATPYLVVLREADLVSAAARSYALATRGGPYASYAGGFVVFAAIVSLFGTAVVVNLGLVGMIAGLLGLSLVGLALNVATMRFVADLDPGSPDFGGWEDGDRSTGPTAVDADQPSSDHEPAHLDDDVAYGVDSGEDDATDAGK